DLSGLYVDITKDRMYCDAPDSSRRRAAQFAMHKIFDALCRLLAPVLHSPPRRRGLIVIPSEMERSAMKLRDPVMKPLSFRRGILRLCFAPLRMTGYSIPCTCKTFQIVRPGQPTTLFGSTSISY